MQKQTPDLPLPGIRLSVTDAQPLHRQMYEQLSSVIRTGQIKPGTRLPSTHAFAHARGISRTTTLEAYRDLQSEGYLEAQFGAGTVVVQQLPDSFLQANTSAGTAEMAHRENQPAFFEGTSPGLSQRGKWLAAMSLPRLFTKKELRPFRLGVPALDALPQKAWLRAVTRAMRSASSAQFDYQSIAGYPPL